MKSILDPTFRYVSAAHTDIRRTFARIKREQQKAREAEVAKIGAPVNVTTIKRKA